MDPWIPVPAALWRDPRFTSLRAEHFGALLRLYGVARETGTETLLVPGLSAVALTSHVGRVDYDVAAEALEAFVDRDLVRVDGASITVIIGWPLGAARGFAAPTVPDEQRPPQAAPPRSEDPKAMRRRASAAFGHAGVKTREERLAWIESAEGAEVLQRRGIDIETARSVAVTEPLQPGHDLRSRRDRTTPAAPVTTSGHAVTGGSGHESGHGPVTEGDKREEREEKRETISASSGAREAVTESGHGPVTESVTGHGHESGHGLSGHGVTGGAPASMGSVEALGLTADEVVSILHVRAPRRLVLSYDSQQLAALQRLVTDLAALGQFTRQRVETLADWIAAGGMAWKHVKPDLRYLCGVGVLAKHLAEAEEWDEAGRPEIRRRRGRDAAAEPTDDAPAARDGAAEWAGAVDMTALRLQEEAQRRKSADTAREVAHAG